MMFNEMNLLVQEFPTMKLYIDPATTSYLIQIIAGVVIAAGAVAGIAFSKIKRALKKGKTEEQPVKRQEMKKRKLLLQMIC